MQDLFLILASILMLSVGFLAPFMMTLGYLWVDVFTPQLVSNGFLSSIPISLVFGALAVVTYLAKDRRDPPRFNAILGLQLALAVYITMSTFLWARNPDLAYDHWNFTIKMVLFACFIPFAIRTRVHIEAFLMVYVLSIAAHIVPWGLKSFITGGGYGLSLGLLHSNTAWLAESSTVSAVGVMIAPLILTLRKHTILAPKGRVRDVLALGLIVLGLIASIGTFARTALAAIAVGGTTMWLRSRRKLLFTIVALAMGALMLSVTSDRWTARIETVTDYQNESSAFVRILVWRWTLDFVAHNPFGGGFLAYVGNIITIPAENGMPAQVQSSRAYHNMFFSVLGDQGFPGLALYLSMLACTFLAFRRASKLTRALPEHEWCADMAQAAQTALLIMLAGGLFVEIDWTPLVWYLITLSVCLNQYALRVTAPIPAPNPALAILDDPRPTPRPATPRPAISRPGQVGAVGRTAL